MRKKRVGFKILEKLAKIDARKKFRAKTLLKLLRVDFNNGTLFMDRTILKDKPNPERVCPLEWGENWVPPTAWNGCDWEGNPLTVKGVRREKAPINSSIPTKHTLEIELEKRDNKLTIQDTRQYIDGRIMLPKQRLFTSLSEAEIAEKLESHPTPTPLEEYPDTRKIGRRNAPASWRHTPSSENW